MQYQGFHFTNHALERCSDRSVSRDDVVSVLRRPDRTTPTQKAGTTKFVRTLRERNIQVIATYLASEKSWLVVSVWVRGEEDRVPLFWRIFLFPFKAMWWLVRTALRLLLVNKSK